MPYRLPPLKSLRLFEAAGRHLSFKQAAEELAVTPSAVSHGIKVLEDWLGTPLFDRTQRTLVLTDAGKAYLPQVQDALDLLVAASDAIQQRSDDAGLSISVAPTFGARWLAHHLPDFQVRHPGIAVTLDSSQRPIAFPRDGIDLAIRMGRGDWPELEATCLAVEHLVPVCSPALAETIQTADDLRGRTLLQVNSVGEDWAAWAALAGIGEDALDLETGPRFDNIGMALDAAAEGMGLAIGRRLLIDQDLSAGRLVSVLGPPRPSRTGYWLLAAPGAMARPALSTFRTWICAALGAQSRSQSGSQPGPQSGAAATQEPV
ncbi:transcriptional regulator GcvA [Pelagibius sp.]|uniref:transcriptional regulator GcvA n=1 Tax=Pelagibius sp. TaxID=1931238 RepID=UPI0026116155|nr:transcriptional regulator GcvA [Pelagibius sp.]